LLKNLGCWLGLLTFAKNRPLLSKELDVKQVGRSGSREPARWACHAPCLYRTQVIIDAYQRGRLVAVLPFVNKLLDCCEGSKVSSVQLWVSQMHSHTRSMCPPGPCITCRSSQPPTP
jgi:CCR4-NOT transcription complex subunit 1